MGAASLTSPIPMPAGEIRAKTKYAENKIMPPASARARSPARSSTSAGNKSSTKPPTRRIRTSGLGRRCRAISIRPSWVPIIARNRKAGKLKLIPKRREKAAHAAKVIAAVVIWTGMLGWTPTLGRKRVMATSAAGERMPPRRPAPRMKSHAAGPSLTQKITVSPCESRSGSARTSVRLPHFDPEPLNALILVVVVRVLFRWCVPA